ncbi:hypothetical protein QYE76_052291 [Lolium multiflorum]|uniref:Uncharacterized protein n=1 Tax=Lolium multiflorum TaxID=4521 RepID=A0AAD8WIT6_LOLMU|nr:hypothetical protein QYE76_052291 [Lolium multiflorum]
MHAIHPLGKPCSSGKRAALAPPPASASPQLHRRRACRPSSTAGERAALAPPPVRAPPVLLHRRAPPAPPGDCRLALHPDAPYPSPGERALRLLLLLGYRSALTTGNHCEEQEKFEKVDAMFKAALFSILGDNIVDPYMAFDHGKDAWDALEAKFGVSDAGTELYVMEQYYDYRMTDERSVVEQAHEIQSLAKELEQFKCTLTSLWPVALLPSFLLHGGTLLLLET